MHLNPMAFAVPLFLIFIGIEYRAARRKKKAHRFNESIANLNVGIAERITDLLTTGAFFSVYSWLNQHAALFTIQASIVNWVVLFLATDLVWYWYHRFGHEVNLLWSAHVVHHQSEDFNYTTSVRITFFQAVFRGLFWAILPVLGFPAHMITALLLVHGAYPFFTHTETIGRLGWLEYFLVTPSHHRVHHSANPQYLDKNYGDVLIVWDKLFGTFKQEKEPPVYGLTVPLNSYSFLWQHFHFALELYTAVAREKGWKNKVRMLFGRPDHIDPRIRPTLERRFSFRNTQPAQSRLLQRFITIQTTCTLALVFGVILCSPQMLPRQVIFFSVFILLSLINTGAMMEQRSWVFGIDYARLCVAGLIIHSFFPVWPVTAFFCIGLLLVLLYHKTLSRRYTHLLYHYTS